jgi:hypothetical protein
MVPPDEQRKRDGLRCRDSEAQRRDQLRQQFGGRGKLVDAVTRPKGVPHDVYLGGLANESLDVLTLKIADRADNLDERVHRGNRAVSGAACGGPSVAEILAPTDRLASRHLQPYGATRSDSSRVVLTVQQAGVG